MVCLEFGGCALEYNPSVAHHIDAMRYPHGDRQLFVRQQDRDAAPGDVGDQVADLLNNDWRPPFGWLVDHDEFGVAHECSANCQHLLLAARHHTGAGIGPRGEVWKHLQHVLEAPFFQTPDMLNAKDQVLPHRSGPRFCTHKGRPQSPSRGRAGRPLIAPGRRQ